MNSARLAVCAAFGLLLSAVVQARPDVHEEVATLAAPTDQTWEDLGRFGVAIDGDWALVSAQRIWAGGDGTTLEAAALLYRRGGTQWTYQGILGSVALVNEWTRPGLAMKDGVAAVVLDKLRIFERNDFTGTWTEASYTDTSTQKMFGEDVEIDNGRILVPRLSGAYRHAVLRKGAAGWYVEDELVGHINEYSELPETPKADLQGERAVVLNDEGQDLDPSALRRYRLNENGVGWREETPIVDENRYRFGPHVAMSGPYTAFTYTRNYGTRLVYDDGNGVILPQYGMQPVNGFMQPPGPSDTGIERIGELIATRNYDHDARAYVYNVFRMDSYVPQGIVNVFRLQAKNGASLGGWIDASGNRVIVSGHYEGSLNHPYLNDDTVRIYELPHPFDFPWAYTVDFEEPGSAILGGWQRGPGSNFFSTRVANNGVWRQPSTNGTPYAFTSVTPKTNHGIQAEITLRTFSGTDRWVGLATRWTGESNHYQVALRTSGRVEMNRLQNGVSTTLASAPATLRIGTKVRLRLESIRSTHRVYLNDRLVLTARDSALPEGNVALIMNRAAADYDNLVASPSPFATIYADDFTSTADTAWTAQGTWQRTGGLLRQTSNTTGYSRLFVGALTEDQYVQARVRPLTFTEPDNWVGLMLSYQDERNHAYLSLRGRGVISLWRRTDGVIEQLGTRAISVTPGTWYTLRVEKINLETRVFVNDVLQFSVEGELAPVSPNTDLWPLGRVGLITHKATAEFDDFLAYQP